MNKVICRQHGDLRPVMVHFNDNSYGKEYICLRCNGVRALGRGRITEVHDTFGRIISSGGMSLFFHVKNFRAPFTPEAGQEVAYEVGFMGDRIQAMDIRQGVAYE